MCMNRNLHTICCMHSTFVSGSVTKQNGNTSASCTSMLESVDGAHTKSRHGVWTKMLLVQSGIEATRSGLLEAGSNS